MNDEDRIERLTELAQKAYRAEDCRPKGEVSTTDYRVEIDKHNGALLQARVVSFDTERDYRRHDEVVFHGDRALDALEAALCALAGEPPAWVEKLVTEWKAEADRIPKYEKYDHSVPHVRAAVITAEKSYRTLASQLLKVAKKGSL